MRRSDVRHQAFPYFRELLLAVRYLLVACISFVTFLLILLLPKPVFASPKVDVVIFVNVIGDGARVGAAYSTLVSRTRVQEDISHILQKAGWHLRDEQITSESSLPGLPPSTSALLTLVQSPQWGKAGPSVVPYVEAFRRFHHIEIDFLVPGSAPGESRTIHEVGMEATLERAPGVYRYIVHLTGSPKGLEALNSLFSPSGLANSAAKTGSFRPVQGEQNRAGDWTFSGVIVIILLAIIIFIVIFVRRR